MGVILRTAGASRTKTEVKRDFEYLMRLWETVRDLTLKSTAPKLVYEEGSLVKRSIRDLYNKDIDEIIVAGDEGHKEARDFMRMLMPSHVKHVKLYKDTQPLFTRWGIESQLDAMFSPVVQLRSGGYIVINQAEALVAIDVNSGRATREHHIEDTALKTNCEAAEEIARQLRLRDLAGLIVIDFIDMDETRNNRTVERRMKDALKNDRARIQVGRISHFGLLEMSRQRIRSSVLESSTEKCPLCGGSGHVRSVSSVALQLLRALEEMLIKGATHNLIVRTRSEVALYVLNHKRGHLRVLEERFRVTLTISADATVTGQVSYIIDRGEQVHSVEAAKILAAAARAEMPIEEDGRGRNRRTDDTKQRRPRAPTAEPEHEAAWRGPRVSPDATARPVAKAPPPQAARAWRPRPRPRTEPREGAPATPPFTRETVARARGRARGSRRRLARGGCRRRTGRTSAVQGGGEAGESAKAGTAGGAAAAADDATDAVTAMARRRYISDNDGRPEPDLQDAVEDLDRPPRRGWRAGLWPRHARSRPAASEDADVMAPPAEQRPARRRRPRPSRPQASRTRRAGARPCANPPRSARTARRRPRRLCRRRRR